MPRQLPWMNKGSATKTQVKSTPKPAKRTRNDIDDDDEFLAGTILAPSRKGKERADLLEFEYDNNLPSRPRTPDRKRREPQRSDRLPSSSPPPADAKLSPPGVEYMKKCVDKFELRDDEWMMVEDEFLQTAKLFTRHLHLAEYERLKKAIQIKRDTMRPIVPGVTPSEERQFQMKAQEQLKAQKKAVEALLMSEEEDVDDHPGPPKRANSSKFPSASFSKSTSSKSMKLSRAVTYPIIEQRNADSGDGMDSDDLDAPPKPSQKTRETPTVSFAKPASPLKPRPTPSRRTFGFLDDHSELPNRSSPTKPSQRSNRSSSPTKSIAPSTSTSQASRITPSQRFPQRPGRVFDFFDNTDLPNEIVSKEQNDRLAKRKAEREREKEKQKAKKKDLTLDDVPTFLF